MTTVPAFPQRPLEAHRGAMILVFGILSLVVGCFVFGIVAWVMGNGDLRKMSAGVMDPQGRSMTEAGKVCGMISTILAILSLVGVVLYLIVIFGLLGVAAGASL